MERDNGPIAVGSAAGEYAFTDSLARDPIIVSLKLKPEAGVMAAPNARMRSHFFVGALRNARCPKGMLQSRDTMGEFVGVSFRNRPICAFFVQNHARLLAALRLLRGAAAVRGAQSRLHSRHCRG